jgi:hypothetical protein
MRPEPNENRPLAPGRLMNRVWVARYWRFA